MSRLLQNRIVFYTVCALFALAVGASFLPGGSLPAFGGGLLPESSQQLIAQSPLPPPDPGPEPAISQTDVGRRRRGLFTSEMQGGCVAGILALVGRG
jgi:hypothetical protein